MDAKSSLIFILVVFTKSKINHIKNWLKTIKINKCILYVVFAHTSISHLAMCQEIENETKCHNSFCWQKNNLHGIEQILSRIELLLLSHGKNNINKKMIDILLVKNQRDSPRNEKNSYQSFIFLFLLRWILQHAPFYVEKVWAASVPKQNNN